MWAIPPRGILLGVILTLEHGLFRHVSTTKEPMKDERW